jgi:cytochrome P450
MVLDNALKKIPSDANVLDAWQDLFEQNPDANVFLMDLWPMYPLHLMVWDPEAANQITIKYNLGKPTAQHKAFAPIVGGESMITMSHEAWKPLRALFNPGFSGAHMLELVPAVVDSVQVFCELLRERAGLSQFSLDGLATRLTMDVIAKVALDSNLDNQRKEHYASKALNTILAWHSFWDPRILLNPLRPFVQWYYGWVLDTYLRKELQKRYSELRNTFDSAKADGHRRDRSVIALALEDYLKQQRNGPANKNLPEYLDERFMRLATTQIRLFIFAGNDSTSTTIVYAHHMLYKHPEVKARLRKEHDDVFGSASAGEQLKKKPALINKCPYTLAIIKEVIRLFPPAGAVRGERHGVSITDQNNISYPVSQLETMIIHQHLHRHPRYWARPDEFLPERWLVEPGHELYPPQNGAYRPFELGHRNCIGQTLVMNEMRIVLILTARTFDIVPAYEEWEAEQRAQKGWWAKMMTSKNEPIKTVRGERAYQTARAGAHPADGYPCRVTLAEQSSRPL